MNPKLITYSLKLILILTFIYVLTAGYGLIYGEDDYLNVKGDTRADTVTFAGNLTAYPVAPLEGEIFYNAQEKNPRYFDGANWRTFGGPKTVATKIVAASNTLDGASRADYFCNGIGDQQEINRAINELPAAGGAVYLLEGTYFISDVINLEGETQKGIVLDSSHNNTAIIGTGRGTVLKIASGASGVNVINASGVTGILISQLMITDANTSGTVNFGINFATVTYSKIDKVWVENIRSNYGITLSNSSNNNIISNNNIQGLVSAGRSIFLSNSSNNIISHNNIKDNGGMGIQTLSSSNNIISDNNVQGNDTQCINLSFNSSYNIVSNNNLQGNNYQGILVESSNNTISNNNIQGNGAEGILLSTSSNNVISDNNVQGNAWGGIRLSSSSYSSTITSNVIYNNGGSGVYDGIKAEGDSDTNLISSNRISDTQGSGFGINIFANTCDNNYLIANLIDGVGYTGRLIRDSGANTKYTDKLKMTLERKQVDINSSSFTLNVTSSLTNPPLSYVALNPSWDTTLIFAENGSTVVPAAGALLILENISAYTVTIKQDGSSGFVNLEGSGDILLGQYDTLRLIWNGSRWLETGYVNN